MRKKVFQTFTDIFSVIMLEAVETTAVKQDKTHNLSITHMGGLYDVYSSYFQSYIFLLQCNFLAKIIGYTINFRNF